MHSLAVPKLGEARGGAQLERLLPARSTTALTTAALNALRVARLTNSKMLLY
jgi:hypothetical protein